MLNFREADLRLISYNNYWTLNSVLSIDGWHLQLSVKEERWILMTAMIAQMILSKNSLS